MGRVSLATLLLSLMACGRFGFEKTPNPATDAGDQDAGIEDAGVPDAVEMSDANIDELAGLCPADDGSDIDSDGIPDACDPCIDVPGTLPCSQPVGNSIENLPSWQERAMFVGVNAIRVDPPGYRDAYMTFSDGTGATVFNTNPPPLPPLSFRRLNGEAARFHAEDAVACETPVTTSDLCDGTPWTTWRTPYDPLTNVVFLPFTTPSKGNEHPFNMVGATACGTASSALTFSMCKDDTDPIRQLMFFDQTITQFGTGHAEPMDLLTSFWEFEFSNIATAFDFPIVTAGHFFYAEAVTFGMNVEATTPIQDALVFVDGVRRTMTLDLGTSQRGFYKHVEILTGVCRSYHFILVDGDGNLWRHPTQGDMRTGGDGACDEAWKP
jgi:hypothetical protein